MPASNEPPVSADASRYACAGCGRRISLDDLATSLLMEDGSGGQRLYHSSCWVTWRLHEQPRLARGGRVPFASRP